MQIGEVDPVGISSSVLGYVCNESDVEVFITEEIANIDGSGE